MKRVHRSLSYLFLLIFITYFNSVLAQEKVSLIFFIGDGMGLSQLSSAYYYKDGEPSFSKMPVIGLSKTSSAKEKITDSAAGATAFACGKKTFNKAIGVDVNGNAAKSIMEIAIENGYKTGIIATSSLTHATPASFYAHNKSRYKQDQIALDLLNTNIDFLAGGGLKYFQDNSKNKRLIEELKDLNYKIDIDSLSSFDSGGSDRKYLFLGADDGMPTMKEGRGDFLERAMESALNYFGHDPFILIIEASQIDWGGHSNNADYIKDEVLDLERCLSKALTYQDDNPSTLILLTADHETGGYTLAAEEKSIPFFGIRSDYSSIEPSFSTKGHSATMVPVLAKGPYENLFMGIYENTEIFNKMLLAIGLRAL